MPPLVINPIFQRASIPAGGAQPPGFDFGPGWTLEIIGTLPTNAYPSTAYETRVGAIGGVWPYTYELFNTIPSGMAIESDTGIITWAAPSGTSAHVIDIRVTDQLGEVDTYNYTIDVDATNFFFIDAAGGSDAAAGTIGAPWETFGKALTDAAQGDSIYLRDGTYNIASATNITNSTPTIWQAFPGDTQPVISVSAVEGVRLFYNNLSGSLGLFQGIEFTGGDDKTFDVDGGTNLMFYKNFMHDIVEDGANNNPAFVSFVGITPSFHTNFRFMNNVCTSITGTGSESKAATIAFDVQNSLWESNHVTDIPAYGLLDKDGGFHNTYRDNYVSNCVRSISVKAQSGTTGINIHHNLVIDGTRNSFAENGNQSGTQTAFSDVWWHHNLTDDTNFEFFDNFGFTNDVVMTVGYNVMQITGAFEAVNSEYHTNPGSHAKVVDGTNLDTNNNIINLPNSDRCAGEGGGSAPYVSVSVWVSGGRDANSVFTDPGLIGIDENVALPGASPYIFTYGYQIDGFTPGWL